MKVHDISITIKAGMLAYPGDPEFSMKLIKKIPNSSSNVSELRIGTHTGTHIDYEKHIENNGEGIDRIPLEKLVGKCIVLDMRKIPFGKGIKREHLKNEKIKKDDIILFKTKNSDKGYDTFYEDFIYLEKEAAEYLRDIGIKAVGIDYLSIQKFHSKNCAAHCVLLNEKIPILETLNLSKIKPKDYFLVALPLKVKDADGAPMRVILIEDLK